MNQEKIGSFIKKLRLDYRITQKEFADMLGVTYQAVSKWENGRSIPDIETMKLIGKNFNVSLDELYSGEFNPVVENRKNNKLIIFIVLGCISFLVVIITLIIFITKGSEVFLKNVSTTCSDFKITGSAAFNNSKSSLHISSIEFCGEEDGTIYNLIKSTLYETFEKKTNVISTYTEEENISISDYIKKIDFYFENYSTMCKNFAESDIYIEIEAISDNTTVVYKIPLTIEDHC